MILRDLSIGKRLAAGFGFVLFLVAVLTLVSIANLRTLNSEFARFEGQSVARERLAYQGLIELGNTIHYFKNAVLRGKDYPQKFTAALDAIDRLAEAYRAGGEVSPEAEAALGEIAAGTRTYRQAIAKVVEMRAANAAVTEIDQAIAGADKPIAKALTQLVKIQNEEAAQEKANFEAAVQRTMLEAGLIAAVILAIGALSAWLISRSVTRPLARAVAVSQAVAAGDLSVEIGPLSGDETGALLAALQNMIETFRGFVQAQAENAREHAAGMIEHRIEASRFPGIYGQMAGSINELAQGHIAVSQQVLAVVQRYALGDLTVTMARLPGQQARITQAVDGVKASLQAINTQIKALVDAAVAGNFTARGEAAAFQYEFRDMLDGMNELMAVSDRGLGEVSRILDALAQGDLTQTAAGDYQGTFGKLMDDSNATVMQLRQVVGHIKEAAEAIETAAKEIATGNQELSGRTEAQASSLEETSSSMEELNVTVKQNADSAIQANALAQRSNEAVSRGGAAVKRVVATMTEIQQSSRRIADIIGVIDGIAFQTNILALNAAVEAARAGEQGRGFAVVASEVRNLAQRSAGAAKEIKGLIADSAERVDEGAKEVQLAGQSMDEVVSSFRQVAELVVNITNASREQSSGIELITQAVSQMDDATQQNAALVEQAASAAESLEEQAIGLVQAVSVFKLDEAGGRRLPAPALAGLGNRRPVIASPAPAALPVLSTVDEDDWSEF